MVVVLAAEIAGLLVLVVLVAVVVVVMAPKVLPVLGLQVRVSLQRVSVLVVMVGLLLLHLLLHLVLLLVLAPPV